ncbi:MAG: GNAT family N-acetyltransferase [Euryarchaeota archaeon]|nr:GNAT family N-acetyltransferase [Euryarchaeota archaeon]
MEWLAHKPGPDDYEGFEKAYREFLHYRLTEEFDELYIMRDDEIIATFALVYRFDDKNVPWIVPELKKKCVFLEFFMVHHEHRGEGLGACAMEMAVNKAKSMGRNLCVVTFEDLDAYPYYVNKGFRPVRRDGNFITLMLDL